MGTPAKLGALILLVLVCVPIQGAAQLIEDEFRPFDDADFLIKSRENFQSAFWVVEQFVNNRIGYALYDDVRRRFNLFDLKGTYSGFLQATMEDFVPDELYKQYLWYGRDNHYKGVFVRQLGGRSLPYEPETPPHLRRVGMGPPPGTYGRELGGQLYPYVSGNVPLAPPEEMKFGVFPGTVEEELERKD